MWDRRRDRSLAGRVMSTFKRGVFGIGLILISGIMLLYVYAFASMVDPDLSPAERRRTILQKMYVSLDPGIFCWIATVSLLVGAIALATALAAERSKK